MNLKQFLKRPQAPPTDASNRMAIKRAMDSGRPVHQERFNYYYWNGWFTELKNAWTMSDVAVFLAINFSRKSREWHGKDRDPSALRDAAKTFEVIAHRLDRWAETLHARADRIEGKDAETEDTD